MADVGVKNIVLVLVGIWVILVGLVMAQGMRVSDAGGLLRTAVFVGLGTYLLYSAFAGRRNQLRWNWRDLPSLQLRRTMQVGDDTIVFDDGQTRVEHKWSGLVRFVESRNVFALMPSKLNFQMIPKRAIGGAAEVDAFRRLLDERVSRPAVPGFPVATADGKGR